MDFEFIIYSMANQISDNIQEPEELKPEATVENEYHIVINPDRDPAARWYVAHTYSGHEQRVARQLKDRIEGLKLVPYVHQVLVPTQEKIRISRGKKQTIKEKLFPGYLLIRMIMNDDAWAAVRNTRGITGFVGMGKNPTPIPQTEVDTIQKFSAQKAPKFKASFTLGEAVKIAEGPFAEFLGTVNEIDDEKGKVKVLVSIFGRETPVELDLLQVAKI